MSMTMTPEKAANTPLTARSPDTYVDWRAANGAIVVLLLLIASVGLGSTAVVGVPVTVDSGSHPTMTLEASTRCTDPLVGTLRTSPFTVVRTRVPFQSRSSWPCQYCAAHLQSWCKYEWPTLTKTGQCSNVNHHTFVIPGQY
jgi:hypothetical protein